MKLKNYYPAVITNIADYAISFAEKHYGFKVIHKIENNLGTSTTEYVLENPDGFRMDVIQADVENDVHGVRINVDDFDAALKIYLDSGFKIFYGPETNDKFRRALLGRNNTPTIMLMQHL